VDVVDGFPVIERTFVEEDGATVGLANISAVVPDVEANKAKILRVARIFKERGVNVAIFPELCLSGYFWEDEERCRPYMEASVIEDHRDWLDGELAPLLDDTFNGIILNGLSRGPQGQLFNRTFVLGGRDRGDYLGSENTYDKVFLPGIEKEYTVSGVDDRLVLAGPRGRFGFTTCYDCLFGDLLREYCLGDEVDAIIEVASWRAAAVRDYPGLNVRTTSYYGHLWDNVLAAAAATNQVWVIACNAVGRHPISGAVFWGGSGIWAPSGMKLVQASHVDEELLIVHNLDIRGARAAERDDFDYAIDFHEIYRRLGESRAVTRSID
jgi:predicted amidohydrolase